MINYSSLPNITKTSNILFTCIILIVFGFAGDLFAQTSESNSTSDRITESPKNGDTFSVEEPHTSTLDCVMDRSYCGSDFPYFVTDIDTGETWCSARCRSKSCVRTSYCSRSNSSRPYEYRNRTNKQCLSRCPRTVVE